MQKILFLFIAIGLCLGSTTAQTYFGKRTATIPDQISVNDSLKILAVLVDFPEDKDATTFGNGKFGSIYSKDYGQSILDPLPHDHNYFANHLEFAKNYYRKVSSGRVSVSYNILPGVITVSKTMRNYSPAFNNESLDALGTLSKEVWQKADSLFPDVNFSDYDLFTIFHAGVGRDISLPGSFGNERDLPSVYLSDKALRSMFAEQISGFPLNRSGKVNTMIIPETESRELDVIGGVSLIEISINGLIAANIASHLGLPDLFDTNTGLSAIGRLGLMDGQAIFAYNGLFPPEPSPWEKMYLGWINPVEVRAGGNFSLIAKGAIQGSDTPVIKIPINSSEYYLVENRNRDAKNDGAIITYISGGQTYTRTFLKDTTGFYSYDVDSISGVVIDVDDYDWALPGNGILIWHIDENVIRENIAANKINANKFRRGVDIEEADGIQEIGEKFYTIFGDEVIGEGTEEDFWYRGNKAKLYKNRFDKNSIPSSLSNDGGNSLISLSQFSAVGTSMSFQLTIGDSILSRDLADEISGLQAGPSSITTSSSGRTYVLNNTDLYYRSPAGYSVIESFSIFKPVIYSEIGADIIIGVLNNSINIIRDDGTSIERQTITTSSKITAPPVISADFNLLIGVSDGGINNYALQNIMTSPQFIKTDRTGSEVPVKIIAAAGNYVAALKYFDKGESPYEIPAQYQIGDNNDHIVYFKNTEPPLSFALIKNQTGYDYVVLERNNIFNVIDNNVSRAFKAESGEQISSFSVGDLRDTGEATIFYTDGSKLNAVNLLGVGITNFPYEDTSGVGFSGEPLLVDYNAQYVSSDKNSFEILTYTKDGRIFLITADGKKVDGFPVATGAALSSIPSVNIKGENLVIKTISDNNLYSWTLKSVNAILYWSEESGSNQNNSFVALSNIIQPAAEFFPKDRAYNWPNPVYEDFTNIRYYVSEDSHMNIKIFDLAGDFVAEINQEARGGFDNEVRWDVTSIQSGVYLARIEASGTSGKNENTIIKIAVIK